MASNIDLEDFLKRLGRTRQTIEESYVSTSAGRSTARLLARLDASLSRPLRVEVLGEANSGKTTLINRILGSDLLATDVIQNTRAVVRVSHAPRPSIALFDTDGSRRPIEPSSVHSLAVRSGATIEVGVPLSRLTTMEFLDTPGIGADEHFAGAPAAPWRAADIAVWCTIATQAWRASEVATWQLLGRPAASSLLAVTRTDLLAQSDREKVRSRLGSEAGPMFRNILMFEGRAAASGEAATACLEAVAREVRLARCRKAAAIVRQLAQRLDPTARQDRLFALSSLKD